MSDLPTISKADISPDSPYLLSPSSKYVLGEKTDSGIVIHSQHRLENPARVKLKKLLRYTNTALHKPLIVYRVVRKDGPLNG